MNDTAFYVSPEYVYLYVKNICSMLVVILNDYMNYAMLLFVHTAQAHALWKLVPQKDQSTPSSPSDSISPVNLRDRVANLE
jgi:hypothetical protein